MFRIAFLLGAAFLVALLLGTVFIEYQRVVSTPTLATETGDFSKVPSLMRYHGTLIAFREGDQWYFVRDGRKCRLWDPERK